jgi:hypothetical protein
VRTTLEVLIASMTSEIDPDLHRPKWEPLHEVSERLGPEAPRSLVVAEHMGGMLRAGAVTMDEAVSVAWRLK